MPPVQSQFSGPMIGRTRHFDIGPWPKPANDAIDTVVSAV